MAARRDQVEGGSLDGEVVVIEGPAHADFCEPSIGEKLSAAERFVEE